MASLGNCLTGCKLLKLGNRTGGCIKLAEVYYSIHVEYLNTIKFYY